MVWVGLDLALTQCTQQITQCFIKHVSALVLRQTIPKRGKGVGWLVLLKRKGKGREGGHRLLPGCVLGYWAACLWTRDVLVAIMGLP